MLSLSARVKEAESAAAHRNEVLEDEPLVCDRVRLAILKGKAQELHGPGLSGASEGDGLLGFRV